MKKMVRAKKLIEKGANVNERNTMGSSPLIYAVTFNRPEIAEMLLTKEADIAVKDARGNTALDHAKLQGSPTLIDLLESKG
jgi:ankyrin repeat protein